jgi:Lysophospholipase L1 and related esterases
MYKKYLWYVSICITIISLIVVSIGFVKAMNFTPVPDTSLNTPSPQNTVTQAENGILYNNPKAINVLMLGDSIAKGTGDEKAKGIGGYLVDLLKSVTPKEIVVDNEAVAGYKIDDLTAQIKSGKLDKSLANANLVVISVGGSELQEIQSIKNAEKEQVFNDKKNSFTVELKDITKKIRELNKNAQIIFIGSYNPLNIENTSENVKYLDTWNYNAQLVLSEDGKAILISTNDLFKNNLSKFLSKDKVNPNSTGYQTIAYLISKSIDNIIK